MQLTFMLRLTTVVSAGVKAVMLTKPVMTSMFTRFMVKFRRVMTTGTLVVMIELKVTSKTMTVIVTLTVLSEGGLALVNLRTRLSVLIRRALAFVVCMVLSRVCVLLAEILALLLVKAIAVQVIVLLGSTGEAVVVVVLNVGVRVVVRLGGRLVGGLIMG